VVKDDPDDNRIVECAVASGSDCIVTGDNHLLRLGEYAGIKMVRVGDFLQQGIQR
jgi:predicted nucleic acid-binding protein